MRSARWLKIEGHPDLAAYDETLWIDARIRLRKDPAAILDDWLANDDFAMPLHSFRDSVVAEFEVILQLGMDDSSRLYEQLTHYTSRENAALRREAAEPPVVPRRWFTRARRD